MIAKAKTKLMYFSREKKLDHFYSLFNDGQTVLDVGVSGESAGSPSTLNYFMKNYRHHPGSYSGLGVDDLSGLRSLYPEMNFVEYDGGRFPFADKSFHWIFSNAVIEHVGDIDAQLFFLNEMIRVARNVFFTTPNKYFPVESHTKLLFVHYYDDLFYALCKKKWHWMTRENFSLLSYPRLSRLLQKSHAKSYSLYKNRIFGVPMTFTVICSGV